MSENTATNPRQDPPKLGLALSGGGFRATIFHIGVLRRLAELDLLREVSAISTVSGGSITGAHYLLHLKDRIDRSRATRGSGYVLTRDDYVDIVAEMERDFRRGVAKNPRSRLFLNFFWNLKIFCFAEPPGERMASIYQKLMFADVTKRLEGTGKARRLRPGIALKDMWIALDGDIEDIEAHNRWKGADKKEVQRVPKLILNSSCLNSGRAFRFSAAEVGDARLGFIRMDEATLVKDCKLLLARARNGAGPEGALDEFRDRPENQDKTGRDAVKNQRACLAWFLSTEAVIKRHRQRPETMAEGGVAKPPAHAWDRREKSAAAYLSGEPELSRKLVEAEFGVLRRAKVAAWYLLDEGNWTDKPEQRRGGYTRAQHEEALRMAVADIDRGVAESLRVEPERYRKHGTERRELPKDLLEFVVCLYYLRSARAFAWDVDKGLDRLRLVDAAAASANFPPVFTPYHIRNLYDAGTVKELSLTDGGVHDNTGIVALMEEDCSDIIASDVSGLFRENTSPGGDRLSMMGRIGGMLTAYVRDMQLGILHDRAEVSRRVWEGGRPIPEGLKAYDLVGTVFFHMLSSPADANRHPSVPPHPYAKLIANVRTDLDVFGTIEIDALIYQGYQLADRFVREYLRPDVRDLRNAPPGEIEGLDTSSRAGKVLAAASLRVGRCIAIYKTAWSVVGIIAVVALIWIMYRYEISVADIVQGIGRGAANAVGSVTGSFADRAKEWSRHLWNTYASFFRWMIGTQSPWGLLVAAFGIFALCSSRLERTFGAFLAARFGGRVGAQTLRLKVARIFGPWRRNLTWFLWLLPVWIALLGTVFFGILMVAGLVTRHVTSGRRGSPG